MPGPGAYRPDPTEGITRVEDLPQPRLIRRSRNATRHPCPPCGHRAYRDTQQQRTLHALGALNTGRPRDLQVTYAQYSCPKCHTYVHPDLSDVAPAGSHDTHRVSDIAVRVVVEDGLPYRTASWHLWAGRRDVR
jgi:transposase